VYYREMRKMDKDLETLEGLELDQLADLADALEFETAALADELFEINDESDKSFVMERVMEVELLLVEVKRYIRSLEL
jgi:hypothetical protein